MSHPVTPADPAIAAGVVALAASHGIHVDPGSLRLEEAGLDYRVAFATGLDGVDWVLRVPRRPELAASIEAEARILTFLRPRLSVAVPAWRVCSSELVAYPRLPGAPGLTLDPATKAPRFHLDPTSPTYAAALGRLIAELHHIDPAEASAAGVPVQSPADVRATWRGQVDHVVRELPVAPASLAAWRAWLDDDGLWPDVTTITHGELYPAHVLVDGEEAITGVLDWTTAKVGDPAVDFMFQHMMAGAGFDVTVRAYEEAGGRHHPRLAARCAALAAAGPVLYGIYALTTGDPAHLEAAVAQLDPRS